MTGVKIRLLLYPFMGMAVLLVISAFVLEVVLTRWYIKETVNEQKRVIAITLDSIARIGAAPDELQLIAEQIGLVRLEHQILITDINGNVIGDSRAGGDKSPQIDSIEDRREYTVAQSEEYGFHRGSDMRSGAEMLFLVKRFQSPSTAGYIHVATSASALNSAIVQLRTLLAGISGGVLIFLIGLLVTFRRHLVTAVEEQKAHLESRVKSRTEQIVLLQRLVSMLAACNSLEEIQRVIADIVPRILGDAPGAISLINASRNQVELRASWSGEWRGTQTFELDDCWALRKGKFHLSHDELSNLVCPHMEGVDKHCLCIPLAAYGETLGLLHLLTEDTDRSTNEITFTVAEHLGLALANLNMQKKLKEQATRDPLTGLFNRRYMEEFTTKELKLGVRHSACFSLLMIDIDNFKRFNDTFGHDAGDFVLATIADIILKNIRGEDVAFRLGGEELAILLPLMDADSAFCCAEKLRLLVKNHHWEFKGCTLGKVSMSVGVATYPTHGQSVEELTKIADVALYHAKENGRDQCQLAKAVESPAAANE